MPFKINVREMGGASRMDNPEKMATLGTQDERKEGCSSIQG
jgi:hypothetical protein